MWSVIVKLHKRTNGTSETYQFVLKSIAVISIIERDLSEI